MDKEIEVETVEFEDKKYIILDEINIENTIYVYLSNINDSNDFLIQKLDDSKEYIISLNSKEEFDKALLIYTNKHIKSVQD